MPTMTSAEARAFFVAARVARLATVDEAGSPHLVPVVFAADADMLLLAIDHKPKRTTSVKRLSNIAAHSAVALLVDHYEEDWSQLWWVRADGQARVLESAEQCSTSASHVARLRAKYAHQYVTQPPHGPVIEITISRWSGWRAWTSSSPWPTSGEPG